MARVRSKGAARDAMELDKNKILRFVGLEFVRVIKEMLSRPGTGRLYNRGGKRGKKRRKATIAKSAHRASAPGEPPARDRGILIGSIGMDVAGEVLTVGTGQKKAIWLEFGTLKDGGHMEARPFMRPSLVELKKLLPTLIGSEVRNARRRG